MIQCIEKVEQFNFKKNKIFSCMFEKSCIFALYLK